MASAAAALTSQATSTGQHDTRSFPSNLGGKKLPDYIEPMKEHPMLEEKQKYAIPRMMRKKDEK